MRRFGPRWPTLTLSRKLARMMGADVTVTSGGEKYVTALLQMAAALIDEVHAAIRSVQVLSLIVLSP